MKRNEKQELIKVLQCLQQNRDQFNYIDLKNIFNYVGEIMVFELAYHELDQNALAMLKNFITAEE